MSLGIAARRLELLDPQRDPQADVLGWVGWVGAEEGEEEAHQEEVDHP